ncbi:MAG: branched-chain amino acid ABC transporter permease [Hyphomicrobiales bacterium]|nr:branched-chain amino acid ABC transporter permease [Hyphomicrobiales bacterium]
MPPQEQSPRSSARVTVVRILPIALVLGALIGLPRFADMAFLNAMVMVCIAALYAMGYNLLWGQAGLISFGHATYFAFGASCTIMTMAAIEGGSSFPTPLLPLAGGAASFLMGLVAGWFATIRTGVYFAMITVAITELVRAIVQRWDSMFGGEAGITSIRMAWGPIGFQKLLDVYYFTLAWTIIGILLLWFLQRSPLGTVIRGIREQEERVRFLGYDTHALKTLVFAISAGVSGMAGGLLAFTNESTNVALYEGAYSTTVLINTVIGGAGVFLGPVVGATLTTLFGYYVANLTYYWLLYMGLLFMVIVVYAPRGISGLGVDAVRRLRSGAPVRWDLLGRFALGWLVVTIGAIMTIELIGAVVQPSYGALARSSGVAWPPVRVFWVSWSPASPLTLGGIALLFGLGAVLLRDTAGTASRNVSTLADAIAGKPGPGV